MTVALGPAAEIAIPAARWANSPVAEWLRSAGARRSALALGIALAVAGTLINIRATITRGEDFDQFYVLARSLLVGFDVYVTPDLVSVFRDIKGGIDTGATWGMFYPPPLGAVFIPFSVLPFQVAKLIWAASIWAVLLVGVVRLLRVVAPDLAFGYRVLIIGALMCASAVRWGFISLQPAPLILGLLGFYLEALIDRRTWRAFAIATLVVCLKVTLALPFVGLAFVQRRYRLIVAVGVATLVITGLGFARLGGGEAFIGYEQNMQRLEAPDQLNYPDFRAPNSMQRLDWPYLFNAFSPDLARSSAVGGLLTIFAGAWMLWEWRRSRSIALEPRTATAFLGPLACLSLLSVYHHHYDAIILVAPAIVYLAQSARHHRALVVLFVVPVVLYAGLFEVSQFYDQLDHAFGSGLASLVKLVGVVCVNICFLASGLLLHKEVQERTGLVSAPFR